MRNAAAVLLIVNVILLVACRQVDHWQGGRFSVSNFDQAKARLVDSLFSENAIDFGMHERFAHLVRYWNDSGLPDSVFGTILSTYGNIEPMLIVETAANQYTWYEVKFVGRLGNNYYLLRTRYFGPHEKVTLRARQITQDDADGIATELQQRFRLLEAKSFFVTGGDDGSSDIVTVNLRAGSNMFLVGDLRYLAATSQQVLGKFSRYLDSLFSYSYPNEGKGSK